MPLRTLYATAAVVAVGALVAGGAQGAQRRATTTIRVKPQAVFRTDRVLKLAANGSRAAVVTRKPRGCGGIVVWTAPGARVSRFALGELGCHFDGVDELALAGGQVAWTEMGGGNDLELTLMTGRLPRGRTKQLEYDVNGDRAGGDPTGGWIGNVVGSGPLLAYNVWTVVCDRPTDEQCGEGDPKLRVTDELLSRIAAGAKTPISSGHDGYALAAAGGARFAVVRSDGVATVGLDGKTDAFVPEPAGAIRAVRLTATALLVEKAHTLELHDPANGALIKSIELGPAPLPLAGATERYALLHAGARTVLVRLADGSAATVALPSATVHTLVDLRLTDAGLFYAYTVGPAKGRQPGRIAFVPARVLVSSF
jgi:hypothetical protein